MNEYEVLQLLMGDCREALAAYPTNLEEDQKLLQQQSLSARERLAARLRVAEKTILSQVKFVFILSLHRVKRLVGAGSMGQA